MTIELTIRATTVGRWIGAVAATARVERDHLSQLDAAIGDGDHGVNMNRGFDAVEAALTERDLNGPASGPPGPLLVLAGQTLISAIGGASGALWGSALCRAGQRPGEAESFDAVELLVALTAALDAIKELGAAEAGDKTMVDALEPALDAMHSSLAAQNDLQRALADAADAAEEGARATVPMRARKGRASYLGERSIGHQDPGATSTAMILRALERTIAEGG